MGNDTVDEDGLGGREQTRRRKSMTGETKVIYFIWYIFMVH